jgi:hypothetical protein
LGRILYRIADEPAREIATGCEARKERENPSEDLIN